MNVAYVFPYFPARIETFAGTDIRALREQVDEVVACNLRRQDADAPDLLRQWELADMTIEPLNARGLLGGLAYAIRNPGLAVHGLATTVRDNWRAPVHLAKGLLTLPSAFAVMRHLARHQPDVVHIFWGHFPAIVGVLAKRALPNAAVTTFLGAYDLHARYRTSYTLTDLADRVFTHVHANVPTLTSRGVPESKITAIPRGVDLTRFQSTGSEKAPRRIAAVGRMVEDKGFQNVVEAFARVQEKWPDATLHMIGDGPYRPELERMVAEKGLAGVTFCGYLPHHQVFAEVEEAEVFMLLSPSERLPNAVKEAMAARCVCVVSDTPGIEELVRPGVDGYVVDAKDWEGAARHIDEVFSDPELCARLSKNAREHIETAYNTRRNMETYVRIWEEALARKRGEAVPAPRQPTA